MISTMKTGKLQYLKSAFKIFFYTNCVKVIKKFKNAKICNTKTHTHTHTNPQTQTLHTPIHPTTEKQVHRHTDTQKNKHTDTDTKKHRYMDTTTHTDT